jgi:group II intron reverse transcriptase/maturase
MVGIDLQRLDVIARLNKDPEWVNKGIYRLLYSEDLYLAAYERLKSKPGNMTPGVDGSTLDGFSRETIRRIISSMRDESFRFSPARRVEIPKANGKMRPLGIASPTEKVVQEAIRMVLEAIYESPGGPTFLDSSHGFRPGRSCHTALKEIKKVWTGTRWFVEGDISSFFDNIDHEVLVRLLRRRIEDERILNLIRKALKAGVLTRNGLEATTMGSPQGSVLSPTLANVYLHELDRKMAVVIARESKGKKPAPNPDYMRLAQRLYRGRKSGEMPADEAKALIKQMRVLPSTLANDPEYIRVRYVRYADDWAVGVIGPKCLAEEIRVEVANFLRVELKLHLNMEKTHIRHANSQEITFLGVRISGTGDRNDEIVKASNSKGRRHYRKRRARGNITLKAPMGVIVSRLHQKGFCGKDGFPESKVSWTVLDDVDIIRRYNAVLDGILNYYSFANNFGAMGRVQYILLYSAAKTLSHRHKMSSIGQVFKRYGKDLTVRTRGDDEKVWSVSFRTRKSFAAKPLDFKVAVQDPEATLRTASWQVRTKSNLGRICVVCGSPSKVQMHHVRHIRKMGEKVKGFTKLMAKLNRKQIPTCQPCHHRIHRGDYDGLKLGDLAVPAG